MPPGFRRGKAIRRPKRIFERLPGNERISLYGRHHDCERLHLRSQTVSAGDVRAIVASAGPRAQVNLGDDI